MENQFCPRCKGWVPCIIHARGPHKGLYCKKYGHWIRWVKKDETEVMSI